ncbi:MAG TPA: hypothetical protein VMM12_01820 [Longimicrobiales bacterium]|nr:hypothetical protein [Longimicrobiales bacterium]
MHRPVTPDDPGSRRRAAPAQGGADRYEVLLEVLEQQAELTARGEPGQQDGGGGTLKWILVAVLVVITAWVWVVPPGWLVPPAPEPPPVAEEEASLRLAMYLQAQRIRVYAMEHGRPPESLAEAGEPLPGMQYLVIGPGVFELTGATERVRLTYRSDQPLREWVGTAADVLDQPRGR